MTLRGLLVDLDGVVRLWRGHGRRRAEAAYGLPEGTIRRLAYNDDFDAAHHGLLTYAAWVERVRDRLVTEFGSQAAGAADLWSSDRGEVDPDMVKLLSQARAAGLRIATLTNNTDAVPTDLDLHGITHLFDVVVNSADIGATKPAPAAYITAAALMELHPRQILFTDDNPANVRAAHTCGMSAVPFTSARALAQALADRGFPLDQPATPPTSCLGEGPMIAGLLNAHGSTAFPTPGSGEATTAGYRVMYLSTPKSTADIVDALADHAAITGISAHLASIGVQSADGTLTEVRLLPHDVEEPGAPATSPSSDVEHLPPWTPALRTAAARALQTAASQMAWSLTQSVLAHERGDALAAAHALDRARIAATDTITILARHQAAPAPGLLLSRYLGSATQQALATSLSCDPLTPDGLTSAIGALIPLLRHARYAGLHLFEAPLVWDWQHLTAQLSSMLGAVDLGPSLLRGDAMYDAALAEVYDRHRHVPADMASGLAECARRWLNDADVLEVGAGTGRITRHLAPGSRSYLALEYSPAMANLVRARPMVQVTVQVGDALALPTADNSIDVVVEHEALMFTADPLRAVDEALRVLRPGGTLLRLLVHPLGQDAVSEVEHAYRQAAFHDMPPPVFIGKGTDERVTHHLTGRGHTTQSHDLAVWDDASAVEDAVAALQDRAWPYTRLPDDARHQLGLEAAHRAASRLAALPARRLRLYALATTIPEDSP
ncbi:HAD-IA family hydrolase [Nonomuraea sp. FMUSA5-5]|uniref:HAD-IA family hydrolase n=1 Tax=Nonomuraea composti TaxID=2720023 RepID=A0ABX1BFU7_9ACTN|nr:HAD-IA family hydrolase [Nonomuraea sp. FMUSA5-5]NJP95435.1 HAD-IA family hydrolase [Nonomuraea sp. FMUSA5-5]